MTTPNRVEVPDPGWAPFAELVAELGALGFEPQPIPTAPNRTCYTATDSVVTFVLVAYPGTARVRAATTTHGHDWHVDWTPHTPVHVQLATLYAVLNDHPAAALNAAAAALGVTPPAEPSTPHSAG
jgi:hypothetical protein